MKAPRSPILDKLLKSDDFDSRSLYNLDKTGPVIVKLDNKYYKIMTLKQHRNEIVD